MFRLNHLKTVFKYGFYRARQPITGCQSSPILAQFGNNNGKLKKTFAKNHLNFADEGWLDDLGRMQHRARN